MDAQSYVAEVARVVVNPYGNSTSGSLMAPNSTTDAMIYVSEGANTLSLASTTTSVVALYDAEATFRNGQAQVYAYERNSANVVTGLTLIPVGRPSTDFLSGGIISSSMKVSNTSASDSIAGTQSQAVLHSIPRDASALTATSLVLNVRDKQNKLITNINSKFDGTQTTSPTEHMGEKMALLRDGAKSNRVSMGFNIATSAATAADGIIGAEDFLVTKVANFSAGQTFGDYAASAIYDSSRAGNTKNPLTFSTFKVQFRLDINCVAESAIVAGTSRFALVALDSANKLLTSVDITTETPGDAVFDLSIDETLVSTTSPIGRVMLFCTEATDSGGTVAHQVDALNKNLKRSDTVSSGRIEAVEETADLASRGVHVCVLEGVNEKASINFHAANVIAGIPDSSTAFIAGSGSMVSPDYDLSDVTDLLQTFKFNVPRAYTTSGASAAGEMYFKAVSDSPMNAAMHARSFKKIGRAFRKIGNVAKKVRSQLSDHVRDVQPYLTQATQILGDIGGERAQMALQGIDRAQQMIEQGRDMGVLQASYGIPGLSKPSFL
uniref:Uncharacterized protein n=1 Tax=viral metagenome TaxID=1070528 RepID=A0A2V0RCR9_9ZZZZ